MYRLSSAQTANLLPIITLPCTALPRRLKFRFGRTVSHLSPFQLVSHRIGSLQHGNSAHTSDFPSLQKKTKKKSCQEDQSSNVNKENYIKLALWFVRMQCECLHQMNAEQESNSKVSTCRYLMKSQTVSQPLMTDMFISDPEYFKLLENLSKFSLLTAQYFDASYLQNVVTLHCHQKDMSQIRLTYSLTGQFTYNTLIFIIINTLKMYVKI